MIYFAGNPRRADCHGWILYTREESGRNRPYIDLYGKACRKYGLSIALGIYEPPEKWDAQAGQQLAELAAEERPAFAVNRTRDYRLAKALEGLGVRVYNNSQAAELGNDKAKACRYMQQRGIPVMPTLYGAGAAPKWYPAVVKSCSGHGGTEVFLLENAAQWEEWKHSRRQAETGEDDTNQQAGKKADSTNQQVGMDGYIIQQAASDLGRDVRVYVVGNRIAASVLRTAGQDFRSNFCLGGKAELYVLSDTERGLVKRAISQLEIGMAGIDFIFHHGAMVFNEIEDMAGARALYSLTDYDIVEDYVKYIREDLGTDLFLCSLLKNS